MRLYMYFLVSSWTHLVLCLNAEYSFNLSWSFLAQGVYVVT